MQQPYWGGYSSANTDPRNAYSPGVNAMGQQTEMLRRLADRNVQQLLSRYQPSPQMQALLAQQQMQEDAASDPQTALQRRYAFLTGQSQDPAGADPNAGGKYNPAGNMMSQPQYGNVIPGSQSRSMVFPSREPGGPPRLMGAQAGMLARDEAQRAEGQQTDPNMTAALRQGVAETEQRMGERQAASAAMRADREQDFAAGREQRLKDLYQQRVMAIQAALQQQMQLRQMLGGYLQQQQGGYFQAPTPGGYNQPCIGGNCPR